MILAMQTVWALVHRPHFIATWLFVRARKTGTHARPLGGYTHSQYKYTESHSELWQRRKSFRLWQMQSYWIIFCGFWIVNAYTQLRFYDAYAVAIRQAHTKTDRYIPIFSTGTTTKYGMRNRICLLQHKKERCGFFAFVLPISSLCTNKRTVKKASPTELRWKQLAKCNAEWQQQQTTEIEEKRTTNTTKIGYIRWKEIILSLCMSSLTLIENSSTHSARIHPVHSRVASTLCVYRQNNGKNTAENEMKKRFCSRKKAPLKTKWLKLLEFNCSCSSAFAQTSGMR